MIEIFISIGAGLISFLSPCVLPLIPGYISFVTGQSLEEITTKKKINLFPLILFSLGFAIVFIIFGVSASVLGKFLLKNSYQLRVIAGVVIIIFSLHILGILNIKFLNYEKKIYTKNSSNIFFPFVIGTAFGFGWTPCIGPILGSILALASTQDNISRAIVLLIFYSLGMAIPFILSGFLMQKFLIFSKNLKKNIQKILKIGGIILLITGILITTNKMQMLGYYLLNFFPYFQNFG